MKLPVTTTPIQVRYSDTDGLGHISTESYLSYMQLAREKFYMELMQQTGFKNAVVVASITIDYLGECFYGDKIEVVTWCTHIGTKSLKLANEVYANGKLSARGTATNVAFNPETRKSEAFPEDWKVSEYDRS